MTANIVIADDHPLFREALCETVSIAVPEARTLEVATVDELEQCVQANRRIALILLDLMIPGANGFSALVYLRAQYPEIPIAIVSGKEEPDIIHKCLRLGAAAYVKKTLSLQEIANAILDVLAGKEWIPDIADSPSDMSEDLSSIISAVESLTPQQFRVAMMLKQGLLNKQIAYELGVSEATIKAHMTVIMRKLRVTNRTQAVVALSGLALDGPAAN